MLRLLGLLLLLTVAGGNALKVMTFNLWLSGREVTDGMEKIAHQIKSVNPDIVALQEVEDPYVVPNITALLGPGWSGAHHCNATYPDTGVVTRHTIIPGTYAHVDYGMSVRIQMKDTKRQVSFWSMHLEYHSYGPYAAYNKLVTDESQIMAGEAPIKSIGRVQNVVELLTSDVFANQIAKSNIIPVIVAGDFNAPSDLDWIESNRKDHGGWVFDWPATKILSDAAAMKDSFRELHPDPVKDPGYTWSTVNKFNKEWDYTIPEPMDRIDFIFYRGPLKPEESFPFCGNSSLTPIPHQWSNAWPSDHFAFVTDFEDLPTSEDEAEPLKSVESRFTHRAWQDIYRLSFIGSCTDNIVVEPEQQPIPGKEPPQKVDEDFPVPAPILSPVRKNGEGEADGSKETEKEKEREEVEGLKKTGEVEEKEFKRRRRIIVKKRNSVA